MKCMLILCSIVISHKLPYKPVLEKLGAKPTHMHLHVRNIRLAWQACSTCMHYSPHLKNHYIKKRQTCTRIYHHNIFPGKSCGSLTATWTCCFHRFTDKPNHVRVSGLALGKRNFFLNSHGSLRTLECKPEKKINKKSDMKIPIQGHIWSRVVTGWSRVGPLISSIGRFSQVTVGHGLVTP